jgi:protein-disulfide isomerase
MSTRTPARSSARFALITTAVVLVALAAIVIALIATRPQAAPDPTEPLLTSDTHLLGEQGGAIELVEFGDFECPACAAFEPYLHELRAEYAEEVTFAFRHLPLPQHPHALDAAHAVEAAARQGRFTEMHDALYAGQPEWAGLADAAPVFRSYAEQLGLDLTQYDADVASDGVHAAVQADADAASRLGVRGTPTFFLEGKMLELTSFDDLRAAVEGAIDAR